tara:strand:+ start:80 stop:460 length:381 start_codon:yes stop_codon:yes gene_type:complete
MNDNKLIAEFMGVKPTILGAEITYEMYGIIDCIEDGLDEQHFFLEEELMFHTEWNWLMPVIEKIEEMTIDDDNLTIKERRYQVDMSYTQCSIYDHVRDGVIASADMGTKLLSTHRAVVEFIKTYNK